MYSCIRSNFEKKNIIVEQLFRKLGLSTRKFLKKEKV